MSRKFAPLSPEFEADHMVKQENIREKVERRQAEKTKAWKAGMANIQKAGRKNRGKQE